MRGGHTVSNSHQKAEEPVAVYEEDPSQFRTEADIFNRVYLPYLQPHERCA